jgi:transposase
MPPGRLPKLDARVEKEIVDAVRAGAFLHEAAAAAGISRSTLHRWIQRGEDPNGEPLYRDFRDAVTRARAQAHVAAVAVIRRAMPDDWKAAAFYLERRDPQNWGRRTAHDVRIEESSEVDREIAELLKQMGVNDPHGPPPRAKDNGHGPEATITGAQANGNGHHG